MKNSLSRFLLWREWFFTNYKTAILSILLPCISFPVFKLTYAAAFGIDDPLPWVYNYFADGNYALEKNILFPHGALAFLLYPLPMGNNVFAASLIYLICGFALCMSLYKINHLLHKEAHTLVTLALLLILSLCDLQLLLVAITLSQIVLYHLFEKKINLVCAVLFSVFALYLKTYSGALCCLLVGTEFVYLVWKQKKLKTGLWLVMIFFLIFFLFRFALFQTLSGSFTFLWGQFQLSSDNSEAVSYYQENHWWFISLSLISFFSIPFVSKDKVTRYLFLLILLPFFAAWKHGMARGEEHHMNGFLNTLVLFTLLIWIITREKNYLITFLFVVSICSFLFNLALNESYTKHKSFDLFKVYNLYDLASNYDSIAVQKNRISLQNCHLHVLPDSIRSLIGEKTTDVYPWNFAYIAANKLNWQPRPVIHSYAAYTSWLDKQNFKHISSTNAAQFLIWELTDMDGNGTKLDGIDSRYILNDEPQSIINFFANYTLELKTPNYLIYKKNNAPLSISSTKSATEKFKFNEWLNVPPSQKDLITRAKLTISKSLLGNLKSFFFKGEAYYVYYELENKQVYSFRIVPKNAADGIWINPFIIDPLSNTLESPVKRIKLSSTDLRMAQPEFEVEFEEIKFTNNQSHLTHTTSVQKLCFNKDAISNPNQLFFAATSVEDVFNSEYLQKDGFAKKTGSDYLTGPLSYELEPGMSTEHFICRLDSGKIPPTTKQIKFLLQAYIKNTKPVDVIFAISQGGSVKWYENLRYCTLQNDGLWHYAFSTQISNLNHINLNEPCAFYVWNADKQEKIYVDNFSVRVDAITN